MGGMDKNGERLDAVLKSLSDPTRRQILDRLTTNGELPVHALTSAGGISQPAVSKHLARLKQAELVTTRNAGRETFYGTNASGLAVLLDWLQQQGAIKGALEQDATGEGKASPPDGDLD